MLCERVGLLTCVRTDLLMYRSAAIRTACYTMSSIYVCLRLTATPHKALYIGTHRREKSDHFLWHLQLIDAQLLLRSNSTIAPAHDFTLSDIEQIQRSISIRTRSCRRPHTSHLLPPVACRLTPQRRGETNKALRYRQVWQISRSA